MSNDGVYSEEEEKVHHYYSPFRNTTIMDEEEAALVILNTPIVSSPIFETLWKACQFRVCADGGANRLYDADIPFHRKHVPDVICGDLDSLRSDVREYYEKNHHTRIVKDSDQDTNDLDKSIQIILKQRLNSSSSKKKEKGRQKVYIYGAFGGRFDQEMASMHALYKWSSPLSSLALYNEENCAFLLMPHVLNKIYMPSLLLSDGEGDDTIGEGPTCGLIPLGGKCDCVTTSGLTWNLNQQELEFGKFVSTSNRIVDDVITIQCSHPLLFTAEMRTS